MYIAQCPSSYCFASKYIKRAHNKMMPYVLRGKAHKIDPYYNIGISVHTKDSYSLEVFFFNKYLSTNPIYDGQNQIYDSLNQ